MPKQKRPPTAKETREAIARGVCVQCGGALEVRAEDPDHDEQGLECGKCFRRYLKATGERSPSYREGA